MNTKKPPITLLDIVLILGLLILAAIGTGRVISQSDYHWNWPAIGQYLLRIDPASGRLKPNILLQGLFTTIKLSIWSMLLATAIGLVMGILGASRKFFRRMASALYVETCRNLPPLVLVFIFYFFIGDQIIPFLGIEDAVSRLSPALQSLVAFLAAGPDQISPFFSAVMTLAVIEGAYIAEIVRSGILAIDSGQWEAAQSIGMKRRETLRLVILPQAVRQILPPLAGQFISTIKDSSIVAVISIQELTFQAMELMAATYMTFEIWITVTVIYFILTMTCSTAASRLEAKLSRHVKA